MFLSRLRVLIVFAILSLITELCDARFAGADSRESGGYDSSGILKARQDESSSCSPWCEPNASCGSKGCSLSPKRRMENMFTAIRQSRQERSLAKRQVPRPAHMNHQQLNDYIEWRKTAADWGEGNLAPPIDLGPGFGVEQPSFCVQKRFEDMEQGTWGAWIAGTGDQTELKGCTVLTIVSKQAVYMCHIWEDAHYRPRGEWNYLGTRWSSGFNDFLLFLGGVWSERARGPAISSDLFQGHDPVAFIMTPQRRRETPGTSDQEYPNEFDRLARRIAYLIPDLNERDNQNSPTRIRWYNYNTATAPTQNFVHQALFEYSTSLRDGRPGWQLFYEDVWTEQLL